MHKERNKDKRCVLYIVHCFLNQLDHPLLTADLQALMVFLFLIDKTDHTALLTQEHGMVQSATS